MAFGSREYEWADVEVVVGGRIITGLRGVEYSEKVEREALFGKGRNAQSIQSGNVTIEGKVTLTQSELHALEAAGGGSVLSLAMDIVVSYGGAATTGGVKTDTIKGVRFTESAKNFKQGDKFMECELPFLALSVIK